MIFKMNWKPFMVVLILLGGVIPMNSQKVISIQNGSFEKDTPRKGGNKIYRVIEGWHDCGFTGETPPDIHRLGEKYFDVNKKASDGKNFLGLVTRPNDTYEGISQRLSVTLKSNKCYRLTIDLAHSEEYNSPTKTSQNRDVNHNGPIKLQVWGAITYCGKQQLLAESLVIDHEDWKQYVFTLKPQIPYNFLTIQSYYKQPVLLPYAGNVLVDNISGIEEIDCEETVLPVVRIFKPVRNETKVKSDHFQLKAEIRNVKKKSDIRLTINRVAIPFRFDSGTRVLTAKVSLKAGRNNVVVQGVNAAGAAEDDVTVIREQDALVSTDPINSNPSLPDKIPDAYDAPTTSGSIYIPNLMPELQDAQVGQKIRLKTLSFGVDSDEIRAQDYPLLDELVAYMKAFPKVSIEVAGHTNNRCEETFCNQLSKSRASAVVDYLRLKGISATRMEAKGYGKKQPVASNRTSSGRATNQRVEIKILSS